MSEAPKLPYQESPRKRFEISHDEHSRERLEAVKELKADVEKALAGVPVALTLHGSLSKGKELDDESAKSADVDFSIIYDADALNAALPELLPRPEFRKALFNMLVTQYKQRIEREQLFTMRDIEAHTEYRKKRPQLDANLKRLEKMADASTFSEDDVALVATALDEVSVDTYDCLYNYITPIVHNSRLLTELVDDEKPYFLLMRLREQGPHSIKDLVDHWLFMEEETAATRSNTLSQQMQIERLRVAAVFALDVGGGMREYRQLFIEELLQLPGGKGDRIWGKINEAIRMLERRQGVPESMERQFPDTLQEAIYYYGVRKRPDVVE